LEFAFFHEAFAQDVMRDQTVFLAADDALFSIAKPNKSAPESQTIRRAPPERNRLVQFG
jgi:hypothetical protein